MEVPRLGVESELQLLACGMATATPDPVSIYDLHCSLQQHWIFNSLHEARDHTYILMDTSWVLNLLSHNRDSKSVLPSIYGNLLQHQQETNAATRLYIFSMGI